MMGVRARRGRHGKGTALGRHEVRAWKGFLAPLMEGERDCLAIRRADGVVSPVRAAALGVRTEREISRVGAFETRAS